MITALIVAPHPDDAELAMGGAIAKMVAAGWNVCIVDLTDGEPTPNGSKQIRAREAKEATRILGVNNRICLDMPNRALEPSMENRKKLADIIRLNRPDILFAPGRPDWHPDHQAAQELTKAARFEAKYHKSPLAGTPHWTPHLWLYFSPHRRQFISPSAILDISDVWEIKLASIQAYKSQLNNGITDSDYSLLERIIILGKFYGHCINSKYGEPYTSPDPIRITSFEI